MSDGPARLDGVFAPVEDDGPGLARRYIERIEKAFWEHAARGETAGQRLSRERRERKEARRAAGKSEPPDLLRKTLDLYKSRGYLVERTETYDPALKRKRDLFGCVDGLAVGHGETVALQATSWDNTASRAKKMAGSGLLREAARSGWRAVVVGWRKGASGRWEHKEAEVALAPEGEQVRV